MQGSRAGSYARHNSVNGAKRQLIGNPASHPSPAWRTHNNPSGYPVHQLPGQTPTIFKGKNVPSVEQGSKIFLSRLPVDVGEKEVEELFKKTVGPVKESFLLYNSQGRSKGMAIVQFQRASDAVAARAKYNGKIVDGRTPIKIEIIYDGVPASLVPNAAPAPQAPSLLSRLGLPKPPIVTSKSPNTKATPIAAGAPVYFPPATATTSIDPPRRQRLKKGAKRVKKGVAASSAASAVANARSRAKLNIKDLDAEMDAYRAEANGMSL